MWKVEEKFNFLEENCLAGVVLSTKLISIGVRGVLILIVAFQTGVGT